VYRGCWSVLVAVSVLREAFDGLIFVKNLPVDAVRQLVEAVRFFSEAMRMPIEVLRMTKKTMIT
jgi:hypothetical protein